MPEGGCGIRRGGGRRTGIGLDFTTQENVGSSDGSPRVIGPLFDAKLPIGSEDSSTSRKISGAIDFGSREECEEGGLVWSLEDGESVSEPASLLEPPDSDVEGDCLPDSTQEIAGESDPDLE